VWGGQRVAADPARPLRESAGDLAKVNLGLKPEVYARAAAELDTIVHNGALVNHAFSYRQLFEPNVLGTVEIMKLAVATRVKALTFISSVGVAGGLDHPAPVTEEEVGTKLCTEHPGDGGYALGCAAAAPPRNPCPPHRGPLRGDFVGRLRGACRSWTATCCKGLGTGQAAVAVLPCRPALPTLPPRSCRPPGSA